MLNYHNCVVLLFFSLLAQLSIAQSYNLPQQQDRWAIQPDGSIQWNIDHRLPHSDHIEMSGEKVSLWVRYGVDTSGMLTLNRTMVFPTFRLLPVRTTASMMYNITDSDLPRFLINDRLLKAGVYNASVNADLPEKTTSINQKGIMLVKSVIGRDG
jgi:hypothetical protein